MATDTNRKHGASSSSTPAASPAVACTLPTDVLLEIVARTDVSTLVRCAAACKPLRRDIISPSFIRRVTGQEGRSGPDDDDGGGVVPPCLLAYLHTHDDDLCSFSLVHPATPTAASFSEDHLVPFMSRSWSADLLAQYKFVTSRGGLVVLRRRIRWTSEEEGCSDLCVYDPMTGERTFFSNPPGICEDSYTNIHAYIPLTAADGIGCSLMLFVARMSQLDDLDDTNLIMTIQTASLDASGGGTWGPVTRVSHPSFSWWWFRHRRDDAVVIRGGVIHWHLRYKDIVSYDVGTGTLGSVDLPPIDWKTVQQLRLSPSADGTLLRLLISVGPVISVWQQQLSASGACWKPAPEAVIDTDQAKLRSLAPGPGAIWFEYSGERSGVALLRVSYRDGPLFILDLKTMEIRRARSNCSPSSSLLLLEVNLLARLHAMKIYS